MATKSAEKTSTKKTHVTKEFPNWVVLVMFVLVILASAIGIVLFSSGV